MQPFDVQFERLKKAVNADSDTALASFLGISQGSISGAKLKKQIPPAWFFQIAEKTGFSIDFLYSGKNPNNATQLSEVDVSSGSRQLSSLEVRDDEELLLIPMVEARLSAGKGSIQVSDQIERNFVFPSSFLRRKGNISSMVVMKVDGDSMQPEIMDGDSVLIDQSKTDIRLGRIFAVGFEDQIYLKRIDKLPGKILLKSVNPAYEPVVIELGEQTADSFRLIGQVLWVGREYQE